MDLDDWDELGPPEVRAVPPGHPRLRVAAIAVGVVAVVVLLGGIGVWALSRPRTPAPPVSQPAEATGTGNVTESFVVTETTGATGTPAATGAPSAVTTTVVEVPRFPRGAKVAYRLDGALWVADESGANARSVLAAGSGAFALSPDGKTLASVGASKTLVLVDVATSKVATVGAADVRPPVWSPSSAWLVYTNGAEVRRVDRDGSKSRYVGKGAHASIGLDGVSYAYADGSLITCVGADRKVTTVTVSARVDDLVLGADRLFYALGGPDRSALALHAVLLDGTGDRKLAGAPADAEAGRYDELALSPDGTWLAYAAAGDDMHSRIRAMRTDGRVDARLSLRHDDYLLRWSADGSRLFFIDGNVVQGDDTQLMTIRPDGSQRATILKGAGM